MLKRMLDSAIQIQREVDSHENKSSFPFLTWTRIPRQPRNQLGFLLYSINTPSIGALDTRLFKK
jgi:hypothetical protein